jgi:hypothetical protein
VSLQLNGTDGVTFNDGSEQWAAASPIGTKNLIINGDMRIAQRGTSQASITTSGYYTVDRFLLTGGNSAGTWTQTQSTDVPTGQGFANSLKMQCTTANASLGSTAFFFIRQRIEAQNLQHIKKGTSSAESLTYSFWVKSNKTGTYIAEIFDDDNVRQISKSYTIDTADTWEKKTITFVGDTSGVLPNDNGSGFSVGMWLVAGSDYTSNGTLNTSWASTNVPQRAVGQVNLADSTSNYINITGVQLEVGDTATPFEVMPYDMQLARCQRYYYKLANDSGAATACLFGNGSIQSSTQLAGSIKFTTQMRIPPTSMETTGTASDYRIWYAGNAAQNCTSLPLLSGVTSWGGRIYFTVSGGLTSGQAGHFRSTTTDAYLAWSAEL